MKNILLGLLLAATFGCSTDEVVVKEEPKYTSQILLPDDHLATPTHTSVGLNEYRKLRSPEHLKAYHVGRIVDEEAGTMTEHTTIYRVENSSRYIKSGSEPLHIPYSGINSHNSDPQSHKEEAIVEAQEVKLAQLEQYRKEGSEAIQKLKIQQAKLQQAFQGVDAIKDQNEILKKAVEKLSLELKINRIKLETKEKEYQELIEYVREQKAQSSKNKYRK